MYRVRIFTTNIESIKDAEAVVKSLNVIFPDYKINVDLEDCDNILRIESHNPPIYAKRIIKSVQAMDFECKEYID